MKLEVKNLANEILYFLDILFSDIESWRADRDTHEKIENLRNANLSTYVAN